MMASDDKRSTGPINLGNPEELSIGDLAKVIVEMTGRRARGSSIETLSPIEKLPGPVAPVALADDEAGSDIEG